MTGESNTIRIAMHIDVTPGIAGGTAQSTQGLVRWLGQLEGPERYLLSAQTPEQADWIGGYRGPNQQVVFRRAGSARSRTVTSNGSSGAGTLRNRAKAALRPSVETIRRVVGRLTPQLPTLPLSDGYYESLECDVLHFPTQPFILCALPTIYNPHDLQHLHYPQFWTPSELARRETVYRGACQFSNTVVVGSQWIKDDVVRQYGVSPDKVQIIPWAPPTAQYPAIDTAQIQAVRQRLRLPATYAFYPAVTWRHKNHLRLLDGIAELRERRGLTVNLVCSGARDDYWPKIEQRVAELNLASQVRFLGFISEADLRAVYRLAQFLVLPSLFEADSCPIHEAWSEGIPVASSNLTGLPDQVGEAGLLFDAKNVTAIADALQAMATDADLRRQLVERGYRRVKDFDWERTAKAYRAVYRRAAGATLSEEDRWLLTWDWMREPRKKFDCQEIS
jgi:glycosyltransferase involved in cell wall biosynthesis